MSPGDEGIDGPVETPVAARRGLLWWLGLPFRALRLPLVGNAFYLMVNTGVSAVFGAVFWLVAARFYSASDVGFAAALIPVTGFLAQLANLGLGIGLIRFLPETRDDPDRSRRMINTSLTLSGLLAMAVAVVFVAGVDLWAPSLFFVRANPLFFAAFVLFSGAFALAPVVDQVFIAYRRAKYVLARNSLFAALKAPLPILFAGVFGVFGLYLSFSLALIVALGASLLLLGPRLLVRYRPYPTLRLDLLRPLFGFSLGNYAAVLFAALLPGALPLLVIHLLSPQANAFFYIAWFLGSMIYVIPGAFTTSLFAEGSHFGNDLARDVRRTFGGSLALLVPAALVLFFAGDWLLGLFGPSYRAGFPLLQWLVAASPFVLVNAVYLTVVRVEKRIGPLVAASAFTALATLAGAFLFLPTVGLVGIGVAWFASEGLVSLAVGVAYVARRRRAGRRPAGLTP